MRKYYFFPKFLMGNKYFCYQHIMYLAYFNCKHTRM